MIPETTIETINNYATHGVPPGDFVRAVLENNLSESFGRADINNRYAMFEIVSYIYNKIPHNCWGSKEIVDNWLKRNWKENERN